MCAKCGCSDSTEAIVTDMQTGRHVHLQGAHPSAEHDHAAFSPGHAHDHDHGHAHGHDHDHDHADGASAHFQRRTVRVEQDILHRNNLLAERNRGWFAGRNITALNFMSSPGAGKTTLLERMLIDLGPEMPFSVVEGDQATLHDAERLRKTGCRVVQINTGAACHLDAPMLEAALRQLNPPSHSVLLIENVGNLICPALFDLGERARIVVASVTEGEDKPQKYPHMFRQADVIVLNKVDLLPHLDFDLARFGEYVRQLNPEARLFPVSASRGTNLGEWYAWMRAIATTGA